MYVQTGTRAAFIAFVACLAFSSAMREDDFGLNDEGLVTENFGLVNESSANPVWDAIHQIQSMKSPCDLEGKDGEEDQRPHYQALVQETLQKATEVAEGKCVISCIHKHVVYASRIYRLKRCADLARPDAPASHGAERSLSQLVWDEDSPVNLEKKLTEIYELWESSMEACTTDVASSSGCSFKIHTTIPAIFSLMKGGLQRRVQTWKAEKMSEIATASNTPSRIPGSNDWWKCWHFNRDYSTCHDGAYCCCPAGKHFDVLADNCKPWDNQDDVAKHLALWDAIEEMSKVAFGETCDDKKFTYFKKKIITKYKADTASALFVRFMDGRNLLEVALANVEKNGGQTSLVQQSEDGKAVADPMMMGVGAAIGGPLGLTIFVLGLMAN